MFILFSLLHAQEELLYGSFKYTVLRFQKSFNDGMKLTGGFKYKTNYYSYLTFTIDRKTITSVFSLIRV